MSAYLKLITITCGVLSLLCCVCSRNKSMSAQPSQSKLPRSDDDMAVNRALSALPSGASFVHVCMCVCVHLRVHVCTCMCMCVLPPPPPNPQTKPLCLNTHPSPCPQPTCCSAGAAIAPATAAHDAPRTAHSRWTSHAATHPSIRHSRHFCTLVQMLCCVVLCCAVLCCVVLCFVCACAMDSPQVSHVHAIVRCSCSQSCCFLCGLMARWRSGASTAWTSLQGTEIKRTCPARTDARTDTQTHR